MAIGVFSYAKRDFVIDAFDWNAKPTPIEIPALDPVGRARQLHTDPPASKELAFLTAPDTRSVSLNPLPGTNEKLPVELTGGTTQLSGAVLGPSGPVANATVRIERFVGDQFAALDVVANGGGLFSVGNLPGGRYRVRAWQAPTFAQLQSTVTYLTDGERRNLSLNVSAPAGLDVSTSYSGRFIIGQEMVLTVSVSGPYVTTTGQVASGGRVGLAANLRVGGALVGGGIGTTNENGDTSWRVVCNAIGSAFATVDVGGVSRDIDVPACSPIPTTTTTTPVTTTTRDPAVGSTSTSTAVSPTTRTTARPNATTTSASASATTGPGN